MAAKDEELTEQERENARHANPGQGEQAEDAWRVAPDDDDD